MLLGGRFAAGRFVEGRFADGRFSDVVSAALAAAISSVTAGSWTGTEQPLQVAATGAVAGNTVRWVLIPDGATTPSKEQVAAGQNAAGSAAIDSGSGSWPATPPTDFTDTLVGNIALGNYRFAVVIDNGALSDVGLSTAFEVDTTPTILSGVSVADGGSQNIAWAFTPDETGTWRVSYWPVGTDPSDAEIASGIGATATATGTAATVAEQSGSFSSVTAGNHQPTIHFEDAYGNDEYLTLADVTVAASDPLGGDTGALYWFASDDVTASGSDVTLVNDKSGLAFDLDTKPAAFVAPQVSGSSIAFLSSGPRVIQTATRAAGNRRIINHLLGGGSMRLFLVVDAATFSTTSAVFFSESDNNGTNQAIWFGAYTSGGNIRFNGVARRFSEAFEATTVTTNAAAATGLCILEWHITQTTWEVFLNGVSKQTGVTTAGNFPNPGAVRTSLGAIASDTAAASAANGNFREIFITGTADAPTAAAQRAALATKYGITI